MKPLSAARYSYKDDPSVPAFDDAGPRTVMDAACGICAKGALWIARQDRAEEFRIIPMQDPLGAALLRHYGMDPDDPSSWLYLVDGQAFSSMEAIIAVGKRLRGWSAALQILRVLPFGLRNWAYLRLARNRYRLSRPVDMCGLPEPALQQRLLRS